jgi:ribosomal protein L29
MLKTCKNLIVVMALVWSTASIAGAQSKAQPSQAQLVAQVQELQKELAELKAAAAAGPARVAVAQAAGQRGAQAPAPAPAQGGRGAQAPAAQQGMPPGMVMPAGQAGGNPANPEGTPPDSTDPQALLDRIKLLEQRIKDLETGAVLSDPETRIRKKEVYVDENGVEYDQPTPGAKRVVTYERERVYRRNNINEKIEEAIAGADENRVQVGVDAGIVTQFAHRTRGPAFVQDDGTVTKDNRAYALASADLYFTAGIAQNTIFFADIVGLSGPPPDLELGTLSLVNGYSARLINQNELNLREAWLRTELFGNRLALTAGRLDLTNYFDNNAAANDETTQFISDALVNNGALGLSENGTGLSIVFDPKSGFNFKAGFQQSSSSAKNLSDSIFSLAEVGYVARLPGMGEGNYRFWYRTDNNNTTGYNIGFGTSIDQKLGPQVTLFGRYGESQANPERDKFYSGGLQFAQGLALFPGDRWGVGFSQIDPVVGGKEQLVEGYYNLSIAEKFNLSFHVQHFLEADSGVKRGYLVPGVRLQASF